MSQQVLDVCQIQLSCARALLAQKQNTMKTRSLYSEILFNMSPSANVSLDRPSVGGLNNEKSGNVVTCVIINA